MGANTASVNAQSGTREYLEQKRLRDDTQNAFASAVASFGSALSAAGLAGQSKTRMAALDLQLEQTHADYRDARRQLAGGVYTAAGANGVRVTGSVAESLTQSLTQMGLDEANKRFDNRMRQIEAKRERGYAKAAQAGSLLSGFGNMIGSAVGAMNMTGGNR